MAGDDAVREGIDDADEVVGGVAAGVARSDRRWDNCRCCCFLPCGVLQVLGRVAGKVGLGVQQRKIAVVAEGCNMKLKNTGPQPAAVAAGSAVWGRVGRRMTSRETLVRSPPRSTWSLVFLYNRTAYLYSNCPYLFFPLRLGLALFFFPPGAEEKKKLWASQRG